MKVFLMVGNKQEEKPVNPDTKVIVKATGEVGYVVREEGDFYYLRMPQTDWNHSYYMIPRRASNWYLRRSWRVWKRAR